MSDERAKRIAEAVREAAAEKCDEYREITAAEKDSALLVGKVDLSNAMSGEPRAAEFLASAIRSLDVDAIIASVPGPWLPIETAPKDGTRILAWVEWLDGPQAEAGCFKRGDFYPEYRGYTKMPTLWTPLPAKPKESHEQD
jgi:hypothetical protein